MTVSEVPAEHRAAIESALRRAGLPVSDVTVLDAYIEGLSRGVQLPAATSTGAPAGALNRLIGQLPAGTAAPGFGDLFPGAVLDAGDTAKRWLQPGALEGTRKPSAKSDVAVTPRDGVTQWFKTQAAADAFAARTGGKVQR